MPPAVRLDPATLRDAHRHVMEALEDWESDPDRAMPSIRQLADHARRKFAGLRRIVGLLEAAGWVGVNRDVGPGQAFQIYARQYVSGRSTRHALHHEPETLKLPVKGRISAGRPLLAVTPDDDAVLFVPAEWVRGARRLAGDLFALRVAGDSMRDDGIHDGDYVIVREQQTVQDGERAVALLPDGTATLKRIYHEPGRRIRLQPANPDYEPQIVDAVDVQGLVIGLLRLY